MDKGILSSYIDACEVVEETEQDIRELLEKREAIVHNNVKGSMSEFPYTQKNFHIEGIAFTYEDDSKLRDEERLLQERRDNAKEIKTQVDRFLNTTPPRIQRIIRLKYFKNLPWEKVADAIGQRTTGESLRKELQNYLKEK